MDTLAGPNLSTPFPMFDRCNAHDNIVPSAKFADGRKNMNDIFDNYICSPSDMCPGLHFQNV